MKFTLIFENKKEEKELENGKTVKDILDELEVSIESSIVKKNNDIVSENSPLNDGDEVKIIQIVYGG